MPSIFKVLKNLLFAPDWGKLPTVPPLGQPTNFHFQSLRYISTTLAAYVGETVTLRFDPRDMAEIRVFHNERFLCRAVCAELAGATVPLREILRARNRRRSELRGVLKDRQAAVHTLLQLKRGEITEKEDAQPEAGDKPTTEPSTPPLKDTGTNSNPRSAIVETLEHRRFTEFCEACRRYAYIGLCYGPPGVGKTLSARSHSRWDKVKQSDRWGSGPTEDPLLDTVFYTPSVVNAPNTIQAV